MEPIQSDDWVEEHRFDAPALYYELLVTRAAIKSLFDQISILQNALIKNGIPLPDLESAGGICSQ